VLSGYNSLVELAEACEQFCENVNGRVHRETNGASADALVAERSPFARSAVLSRSPRRLARPAPSTPIRRSAVAGRN
jgi:hypothetical protein